MDAPERIAGYLAELGDRARQRSAREWLVHLPSTKRGELGVALHVGERTLSLRAFYMRAPDRGQREVYERLMRKHLDMYAWRFALDDAGDLFLLAEVPLDGLAVEDLDRLLGACSAYVDETFESVLRTGFDVPEGTVVGPPPAAG